MATLLDNMSDSLSFDKYLNEVKKISLITKEEEDILFKKMCDGDEKAFQKLVNSNLRFVLKIAKQYYLKNNKIIKLEDLVNEGNIGLCIAIKRYDVNSNYKLITYAVWWIRKLISEYVNKNMFRLNTNVYNHISKLNLVSNDFFLKNGYYLNDEELIELMGIEKTEKVKKVILGVKNSNVNHYYGDVNLMLCENGSDYEITKQEKIENDKRVLNFILNKLSSKDKIIMEYLYGINKPKINTDDLSKKLNITTTAVNTSKLKILKKLKKIVKKENILFN